MVAITIRDIPEPIRDELAARAARSGKSLQEYLRGMLIATASKPTAAEVLVRARARVEATGSHLDADAILAAKDSDKR
jgi:antitoxin FitA